MNLWWMSVIALALGVGLMVYQCRKPYERRSVWLILLGIVLTGGGGLVVGLAMIGWLLGI